MTFVSSMHKLHFPLQNKNPLKPPYKRILTASTSFTQALVTLPPGYTTPSFPSLYWPLPVRGPQAHYLYHPSDIWRFTTVWTVIFYGASHLAVCFWAIVMGRRHWKVIWGLPIVYVVVAGFEALIAGGIVGGL